MYLLVHGLPGSGKSQVLLWLRSYFEDVWHWTHGDEFVFLAPLNSMALNIGGNTLHSYFAVSFKDRRGRTINSGVNDKNWSAQLTKMSLLRFIFVDEVEATGADLLGRIEEECRRNSRRPDRFRFPDTANKSVFPLPRAFGGVNVFLIGDWWQLNPTGGIALMSNPFAKTALECSVARSVMMSVWLHTLTTSTQETATSESTDAVDFALQKWSNGKHVLELSTNIRSGEDVWWNEVLEQSRRGVLSPENYDWIHGYPARYYISNAPLKFWWTHRKAAAPPCTNSDCMDTCVACESERNRRNRLLPREGKLPDPFKEAILITPHNQAVFHYSLHCAREFALRNSRQLMWCLPRDNAPTFFVAGYTKEEMQRKMRNWLFYNARNTEGILSLCPACYDLPVKITRANGIEMKEHGIHNGARGRIRDVVLHPDDLARLKDNMAGEVILTQLPLVIVLYMETPMIKNHPDYPANHFPLKPVTTYWQLGARFGEEAVEIRRRGYGMVPNFSTTIDGATGRTIDKAIAALGSWYEVATFTRAMKGYIGLSRVRCAEDIHLAEAFSPCLFTQGEQPWSANIISEQNNKKRMR